MRLEILLVAIAFGWVMLFAHGGVGAQFSGDDLMNLHGYLAGSPVSLALDNLRYWSTSYRPLGGVFYVTLYGLFGFNPLPFRVACFGLLGLNLWLLWRFGLRLTGSREAAFLGLLVAAYHAWFVDLYYSTGTIYDLLCYCFYLAGFNLYLRVRAKGAVLPAQKLGMLAGLYVCALNSKEMAVTLPVLLGVYEAVYHGRDMVAGGVRWLWREGRGVVLTALLTVPYVAGKLMGAGSLVENPAYRVTLSPAVYLHAFHLYLNPLLYQEHVFRDANTVQLLAAMLGLALWRRSRPLLFSWCWVLLSMLPVAFIAHYAGFFLYLPMAGWAVYAGTALAMARDGLLRLTRAPAWAGRVSTIALPGALALFLAPRHIAESARTQRVFESVQPPSRQVAAELKNARPTLPPGARVLFVASPFEKQDYFLLFLTQLVYADNKIEVEQARESAISPAPGRYDAVFTFRNGAGPPTLKSPATLRPVLPSWPTLGTPSPRG